MYTHHHTQWAKVKKVSLKIENRMWTSAFITLIKHSTERLDREIKGIYIVKEAAKLSLFANGTILHIDTKDSTKN